MIVYRTLRFISGIILLAHVSLLVRYIPLMHDSLELKHTVILIIVIVSILIGALECLWNITRLVSRMTMSEKAIKAKKSHWRGHPIVYVKDQWFYKDTMKPIPAQNGEVRSCGKCGSSEWSGDGEPDECLGMLPGVINACCGHGVRDESYIQFTNGVAVRGFVIDGKDED